ncbi:MAG: hypothetical protein J5765_04050, partial [Clostridia bacterium]|nr:hypothetical protein [Clostridia bacterium]
MEINEVFESYKGSVQEENRNLMTIACDEMQSKQYEEAAAHFGQLYEKAPNDYMAFFFRAYNKNHCGIKLNVTANAERLTSAFQLACQKAVGDRYRFRDNMFLLMHYYDEGMNFLENAAVSFESETKRQIKKQRINTLIDVAETYHDSISTEVELESYVVNYLKEFDR